MNERDKSIEKRINLCKSLKVDSAKSICQIKVFKGIVFNIIYLKKFQIFGQLLLMCSFVTFSDRKIRH